MVCPCLQFVEQPCVLDCNNCLISEGLQHRDLAFLLLFVVIVPLALFVLLARRETATEFICEMPGSPPGILRFVIMGLVEISKTLKRQIGFEQSFGHRSRDTTRGAAESNAVAVGGGTV